MTSEIDKHLKKERELYDTKVTEAKRTTDTPIPISDGVMIFDEIKIAMKLQWNSSNDSLVGYSMTRDELSSL